MQKTTGCEAVQQRKQQLKFGEPVRKAGRHQAENPSSYVASEAGAAVHCLGAGTALLTETPRWRKTCEPTQVTSNGPFSPFPPCFLPRTQLAFRPWVTHPEVAVTIPLYEAEPRPGQWDARARPQQARATFGGGRERRATDKSLCPPPVAPAEWEPSGAAENASPRHEGGRERRQRHRPPQPRPLRGRGWGGGSAAPRPSRQTKPREIPPGLTASSREISARPRAAAAEAAPPCGRSGRAGWVRCGSAVATSGPWTPR